MKIDSLYNNVNNIEPIPQSEATLNNDSVFSIETTGWQDGEIEPKKPFVFTGKSYNLKNSNDYTEMIRKNKLAVVDEYIPVETSSRCRTKMKLFSKTRSMDYEINHAMQGMTGDCWYLATINALASTEKGKQIIRKNINYDENGAYVRFNGIKKTIFVPYGRIHRTKFSFQYSCGDDDVKILELAMSKVLSEARNGNLGERGSCLGVKKYRPLHQNYPSTALELLLGEEGDINSCHDISEIPKNAESIVYSFSDFDYPDEKIRFSFRTGYKSRILRDAKTGKKVALIKNHAYTIKNISDDGIAELVNPWNNGKSIYLKASEISSGCFDYCIFNKE